MRCSLVLAVQPQRLPPRSAPLASRLVFSSSSRFARRKSDCTSRPGPQPGADSAEFWASLPVWRRAAANTTRCLVGCSIGDLGTLWLIQMHAPALPVAATVAAACAAGISTSLALETVVLRVTEGFEWQLAARTAWNMSLTSMVAMELAENAVELSISGGGCFSLAALPPALVAGFLAPLPYNYYMIRKHGRSCH